MPCILSLESNSCRYAQLGLLFELMTISYLVHISTLPFYLSKYVDFSYSCMLHALMHITSFIVFFNYLKICLLLANFFVVSSTICTTCVNFCEGIHNLLVSLRSQSCHAIGGAIEAESGNGIEDNGRFVGCIFIHI